MKWIEALKLFNQGRIWCVPKKGTEDYEIIKEIMRTGKLPDLKKTAQPPVPAPSNKSLKPKSTSSVEQEQRSKLLSMLFELAQRGSSTLFEKVKNQFFIIYPDVDRKVITDSIRSIFSSKDRDFYPTPAKCLENDYIQMTIERADKILEPTAGIGSIVEVIEKLNPTAEITANELNRDFIPILETLFPDVDVKNENFIDFPTKNDFDTIICNPPFSFGSNKRIYLDFLFKCLSMLNRSTAVGNLSLIFICPAFIGSKTDDFFDDTAFFGNKFVKAALADYLKDSVPIAKIKKVLSELGNDDVSEDNEEIANKIKDNYSFAQGQYIGECTGFAGTGVKAAMYQFIVVNRAYGSGKSNIAPHRTPKIDRIIKKYYAARTLEGDFLDGRTKDESGTYKKEEALGEFYDEMKREFNINPTEAFPYIREFKKSMDSGVPATETKKAPDEKKEQKPVISTTETKKSPVKKETPKLMRWIDALKIFNQDKERWCIPRKGTPEYAEIQKIRSGK